MSAALSSRTAGVDTQPAIVLLHAIATSSALWDAQIEVLAERFRVIALDLPGHGGSAVPPSAGSIEGYAGAVLATLDAMGVGRFGVVGLSFGSSIAQAMAVMAPERVASAVLAGGTAYPPPPVQEIWRDRAAGARRDGMGGQVDDILARWFTPAFLVSAKARVDMIRQLVLATPAEGYALAAEAIAGLDNRAILSRIACPTLVVAGEHDIAVPIEALETIARAVPNSRLERVNAGHLMNVEAARQFTDLVGEHLTSSIES